MASILIVDDDRNIRRMIAAALEGAGYKVAEADSGESALRSLSTATPELVLTDVRMAGMDGFRLLRELKSADPRLIVIMMTAYASIPDAVEAMRHGAYDYLPKPFSVEHIRAVVARALELRALREENRSLRTRLERLSQPMPLLALGPQSRKLAEMAEQVAATEATVLITGESGTGKSLLAAHIHRLSPRRDSAFVEVACTTLHEHLLESELFGHVRGAFTGAIKDKPGRLEAADGGTVFLDEIGDIAPAVQAKLLRFLQEKAFEPVGGNQTIHIDARIIAATNQDLEQLVREKRFREDLFYRLNVIEIRVSALRERQGEIIPLAEHLIARSAEIHHKPALKLSDEARAALIAYSWPGNVRELRNVAERAVVLSRGDTVTLSDLPDRVLAGTRREDQGVTLEELERKHIQSVLEQAVTLEEAADMLGINVATLWRKRRRYGLE